jgi:hypothetical protein
MAALSALGEQFGEPVPVCQGAGVGVTEHPRQRVRQPSPSTQRVGVPLAQRRTLSSQDGAKLSLRLLVAAPVVQCPTDV